MSGAQGFRRSAPKRRLVLRRGHVRDQRALALEFQFDDIAETELVAKPPQQRQEHDVGMTGN